MKIGDLSKQTGVPIETLRFWEREGILTPPARNGANYRVYGKSQLKEVGFVAACRDMDMSLTEVKSLLALQRQPTESCEPVNNLLDEHIQAIETRLAQLKALHQELSVLRQRCDGHHTVEDCEILRSIA